MLTTTRISSLNRKRRSPKATAMLEFCLLLPAFVVMIAFLFDMYRIVVVNAVAQEAVYRSARSVAAVGKDPVRTDINLGDRFVSGRLSDVSFSDTINDGVPRSALAGPPHVTVSFDDDQDHCTAPSGPSDVSRPYVTVEADYGVRTITPGLGALFSLMSGKPNVFPGTYPGHAGAVVRCQVAF